MDKFIIGVAILSGISILWKIFGKDPPEEIDDSDQAQASKASANDPPDTEEPESSQRLPPMTAKDRQTWNRKVEQDARRSRSI